MASVTDIINRAAQHLGAKKVSSIDENSTLAIDFRTCYETLRDAELSKHRWSFAIQRASLAADSPAPTWGRANSFTLPADCLQVIPPYPEDDTVDRDWVLESNKIITEDDAPLYLRYIARISDANQMHVLFREALACSIALALCEKVTQSNSKKVKLEEDYDKAIKEAKRISAIQNVPAKSPDDTWITVRY